VWYSPSSSLLLPLRFTSGFHVGCQDPASTSPFWLDRQRRLGSAERALLLTLPVYSHIWRGLVVLAVSVTPSVVSSQLFSHALRGLVVLAVSVTPGVVSWWLFSHALRGLVVLAVSVTPSVVSSRLFSHALGWACCSRGIRHAWRGLFAALLTRLAWAHCSRGIRHTQRGLFAAFLTRLAWARCSGEGWSQRRSWG